MPTTTLSSSVPAPPSGLADAAILNGYVNNVRDTASQALTGVADAGVTVLVYDGTTQLGTTIADSNGAWSYTLGRLLDGTHRLTAVASDAGGHLSSASEALVFKVDTRPPSQPGSLADAAISKGFVNGAHNTIDQALTGKTDAGAWVTVFDGDTQLGTVKAGATGAWSFTLGQLSEGAHKLAATATDAAGNASARSDILAFAVDTVAPGAPTNLADSKIVAGYVNAAHDTADQALTGKAQAYAFVSLYDGAAKLGQVQASETGDWSYTLGKLADGDHSLTATATDKAGNIGPASAALAFTVDTQTLVTIEHVAQYPGAPPGLIEFVGDSEPGASVTLSDGAKKLITTVADENGLWDVNVLHVADGTHTLIATATDLVGNKATTTLLYNLGSATEDGPAVALDGLPKPSDVIVNLPATLPDGVTYDAATHSFTLDPSAPAYQNLTVGETTTVTVNYDVFDGTTTTPAAVAWNVSGLSTFFVDGDIVLTGHAVAPGETINDNPADYESLVGDVQGLSGQAQGGDDVLTLNTPYEGTTLYQGMAFGDAMLITDQASGGDDQVSVIGGPGAGVLMAIGDAWGMSDYATGGDDTVTATGFTLSVAIGDTMGLNDHAHGGDDLVTALGETPFASSWGYGDAQGISGFAVGGDDTVSGSLAYGDAQLLSDDAQGGDDVVEGLGNTTSSPLLFGDGEVLLDNARGGEDTMVGDSSTADQMWGDGMILSPTATTGADLFLFHPGGGHDQIMDFELGKDRIEIDGFGFSGFADLASHFQTTSDGVLISLDADSDVLVRGVTVAQLNAADFVFG